MNFFRRHKNKFFTFGVVSAIGASGLYLFNKYIEHKVDELRDAETKEKMEQIQRQQQFRHTQDIADKTVKNALWPALKKVIGEDCFNTDSILEELKKDSSKVELWQQLKNLVFAKCSCLLICSVFVDVLARIQLYILAGCNASTSNNNIRNTKELFATRLNNYLVYLTITNHWF